MLLNGAGWLFLCPLDALLYQLWHMVLTARWNLEEPETKLEFPILAEEVSPAEALWGWVGHHQLWRVLVSSREVREIERGNTLIMIGVSLRCQRRIHRFKPLSVTQMMLQGPSVHHVLWVDSLNVKVDSSLLDDVLWLAEAHIDKNDPWVYDRLWSWIVWLKSQLSQQIDLGKLNKPH